MSRLKGKVAIVTGGARGMGAAHVQAIASEGGKVVIGDILDEAGQHLAESLGDAARYIHLDVTSEADWEAAVELALSAFGALNVLVNNAGICTFGRLEDYSYEDWNAIIAVNLTGVFIGHKVALQALKLHAPSSIINISSTAGIHGSAMLHGYTATKWAVRGMTKSIAMEVGRYNIRVNSVHPGIIKTPMTAELDTSALGVGALRRAADPEEVANMVVYLASDESSFSTGAEFIVDGGITAGTDAFGPRELLVAGTSN